LLANADRICYDSDVDTKIRSGGLNMIDNIKVGRTIATHRQERGMTQQQLAAALSVSHQAVSKWENGAALPDIQTMIELTRLFGITVEQLISGDISNESKQATFGDRIGTHIDSITSFVEENIFGSKADEAQESEEPMHVPEDEASDTDESAHPCEQDFDIQRLLRMAPFMSKEALGSIIMEHKDRLTATDISRFAPFLNTSTLEELIQDSDDEINWEMLQKLAPFLKREMVDALAKAAAKGERIVKKVIRRTENSASDIEKSIEDVSQKIGSGMGKVAKQAIKFGEELMGGLTSVFSDAVCEKPKTSRAQALRLAAIDRALADGKWDWIAAHLSEIQDENVKGNIAQKALDLGMTDWVSANMPEYALIGDAETALENEDWGKVSELIPQMDKGYRLRAAYQAAKTQNWQWISENFEALEFGENAYEVAMLAYDSDMMDIVVSIADGVLAEKDIEKLMLSIIQNGDYEAASQLNGLVSSEFLENICMEKAAEGKWSETESFLAMIETEGIEHLMELAISQGDFDAIDILDDYLL